MKFVASPEIPSVSSLPAAGNAGAILLQNSLAWLDNGSQWALLGPNSYFISTLGSDVTLSTSNTFFNGPQLSLSQGVYLLLGTATFMRSANGARTYTAELHDGSSSLAAGMAYAPSANPSQANISLLAIATVGAGGATITLRASTSSGSTSDVLLASVSGSSPATRIVAIRMG